MFQSEIVKQTRLSRSRTSEVLSSLEKRGLVLRLAQGRNYRVALRADVKRKNYRHKHLRMGFTRAAEYPYIIPFRKHLRDDLGIEVDLKVYDNGLDVARDLSLLRLDLGIAPILASFMFCSLGAPFSLIAPAGAGGSCLVSRETGKSPSSPKVATTKLSTMELLLKSSMNEHVLPDQTRVVYESSPLGIIRGLAAKRFDAACIWEPYATLFARKHGLSKIISYSEIGEHVCCALSAGNHLDDHIMRKVASKFIDSAIEFKRTPDSFLPQYSALTGFTENILSAVSDEYTYPLELDPGLVSKQFERAGIRTPDPSTIKEMIGRIN